MILPKAWPGDSCLHVFSWLPAPALAIFSCSMRHADRTHAWALARKLLVPGCLPCECEAVRPAGEKGKPMLASENLPSILLLIYSGCHHLGRWTICLVWGQSSRMMRGDPPLDFLDHVATTKFFGVHLVTAWLLFEHYRKCGRAPCIPPRTSN
jgi:hypothetical protein